MKKKQNLLIVLVCIFVLLLGTTLFVSFSNQTDVQEVIVKSITPVYDETSTIKVDNNNVVFNDKNQVVKYNVVLENTQDYDVKISDIKLTTPTEEFLSYKVEGISTEDEISANSTKELTISFETMGIKGWGRNFADELTANISFEKVAKQEEVTTPEEDTKEEEKQPEAPATNIEEIVNKSEKIEINSITNNTIEFKEGFKVEDTSKVETWIYPETEFYGYKEVDESKIIKEIVLEKERLDELEITPGEHNIVLSTEEEVLGYVDIYINENKELLIKAPQDTTDKEDTTVNKPSEDKKEDEDGKIENPYTSDKGLLVVLVIATSVTGLAIIVVSRNKFAKYTVFILMLSPAFTITNAEEVIELSIKNYVSFESQNVMKPAGVAPCDDCYCLEATDYWVYRKQIEKIYIQNEISEIEEYAYKFDVSQPQNGRVIAYLVPTGEQKKVDISELEWALADMYDLYLQADGIIYSNPNASYYFDDMYYLNLIDNIKGFDTSNATDMSHMFHQTASRSESLELDLSNFDTSNVTNMRNMFDYTGYNSTNFTLDVSNFDTSNVTNMEYMFRETGYKSTNLNTSITISNPNTTSYTGMFREVATKTGSQITVNYTSTTSALVDEMIATKTSNSNVVKGNCIDCVNYDIGTEISIGAEKFNVISQTDDTVTMLAQYNLGTDYRQSTTFNGVYFADTEGWEDTPGPKEIDIQTWTTYPKKYVNAYVEYLKEQLGDDTVTGDLITLKDLEALGCTVPSDYAWSSGGWDCYNSPYGWIANGQYWWTRSAFSSSHDSVWIVSAVGDLDSYYYRSNYGVRPVITISKETLKGL